MIAVRTAQQRNLITAGAFSMSFLVVAYAILVTLAAGAGIAREAEQATLNGLTPSSDPGASGSKAIVFGGGSAPDPGTGGPVGDCGQTRIQQLVDSVSEAKIKANLEKLVQDDSKPTPNSLGSRHISSPMNQVKVDWAKQQLSSYGLSIIDQPFSSGGYDLHNMVGRLQGSGNTVYTAGAHIDSIADDSETVAPGADDDGSGVVIVMEAARVLKSYQSCLKSHIDFVGFNDEEEGMEGSVVYANDIESQGFKGLYNMDMLGYAAGGEPCIANNYNSDRDKFMADKLEEVNSKYGVNMTLQMGTYSADDIDSISFWNKSMPSAYAVECNEDSPGYHTTDDTLEHISYPQMTAFTKVLVAGLAELASDANSGSGTATGDAPQNGGGTDDADTDTEETSTGEDE
ncbi:M28 family peptidase [Candidatus Saccharibacteria bacterium]|nr:M28 family peptidase [Candidatus Saccharibacteria bacterium]